MKPTRVDILEREVKDGVTVRTLSCGHKQVQPKGGKVQLATRALCKECRAVKQTKRFEQQAGAIVCKDPLEKYGFEPIQPLTPEESAGQLGGISNAFDQAKTS